MDGLELRLRRIKAQLKQFEVAAKAGISQNKLCEIELGRRKAEAKLLHKIDRAISDLQNK